MTVHQSSGCHRHRDQAGFVAIFCTGSRVIGYQLEFFSDTGYWFRGRVCSNCTRCPFFVHLDRVACKLVCVMVKNFDNSLSALTGATVTYRLGITIPNRDRPRSICAFRVVNYSALRIGEAPVQDEQARAEGLVQDCYLDGWNLNAIIFSWVMSRIV